MAPAQRRSDHLRLRLCRIRMHRLFKLPLLNVLTQFSFVVSKSTEIVFILITCNIMINLSNGRERDCDDVDAVLRDQGRSAVLE